MDQSLVVQVVIVLGIVWFVVRYPAVAWKIIGVIGTVLLGSLLLAIAIFVDRPDGRRDNDFD